jgi:hypothetical protein
MPDAPQLPPEGGLTAHDPLGRAQSLLHAIELSVSALQSLVSEVHAEVSHAHHARQTASQESELAALRREVEQLREGLVSRPLIERAKGILMERMGLSEAQAFDLLSQASQRGHRKLRDVAAEIANQSPLTQPGLGGGESDKTGVGDLPRSADPLSRFAALRERAGTGAWAMALPSRHADPERLTAQSSTAESATAGASALRSPGAPSSPLSRADVRAAEEGTPDRSETGAPISAAQTRNAVDTRPPDD